MVRQTHAVGSGRCHRPRLVGAAGGSGGRPVRSHDQPTGGLIPGSESSESQISKHASRALRLDSRGLPPTEPHAGAARTPERAAPRLGGGGVLIPSSQPTGRKAVLSGYRLRKSFLLIRNQQVSGSSPLVGST